MTAVAAQVRPERHRVGAATAAAFTWAAANTAGLAALLWLARLDHQAGSGAGSITQSVVSGAAVLIGTAVGATVAARFPRNAVGWLVLAALSLFITGGAAQMYGELALAGGYDWAGGGVAAAVAQSLWLLVFGLIGWLLLLYPTGRPPAGRLWHGVASASAVGYPAAFLCGVFAAHRKLDPPLADRSNPLAVDALTGPIAELVNIVLILGCLALLALSAASVVVRYRQAGRVQRAQLKWMLVAATVPPITVLACLMAGIVSPSVRDTAATYGFDIILVAVPLAAALAITRYRLYSVDRYVDTALVYLTLTALLTILYVAAVVTFGRVAGQAGGRSPAAVALATLVAVAVAGPLRRRLQVAVARRLHRRRYDAVRAVEDYVRRLRDEEATLADLEGTLRRAVGDASLRVGWWQQASASYVGMDGTPVDLATTDCSVYQVRRGTEPIAVVLHDPALVVEPLLLEDVTRAAALPLENGRLHLEVLARLEEVNASRQRIVAAAYEERRRIERDLHDGAQQRLVSLALSIRLARNRLGGESADLLDDAADQLTAAVREVRELARGIHPAALTEEGLAAALESLADRTPVDVAVDVPDRPFPDDVAAAAYFTACEVVTNAVKHSGAGRIRIRGAVENGSLVVEIRDDGAGGAVLRAGGGLQGLADRLDALGGRLTVRSVKGEGTTVRAEVPCEQ
jgi:signal transduction histidine kinase